MSSSPNDVPAESGAPSETAPNSFDDLPMILLAAVLGMLAVLAVVWVLSWLPYPFLPATTYDVVKAIRYIGGTIGVILVPALAVR